MYEGVCRARHRAETSSAVAPKDLYELHAANASIPAASADPGRRIGGGGEHPRFIRAPARALHCRNRQRRRSSRRCSPTRQLPWHLFRGRAGVLVLREGLVGPARRGLPDFRLPPRGRRAGRPGARVTGRRLFRPLPDPLARWQAALFTSYRRTPGDTAQPNAGLWTAERRRGWTRSRCLWPPGRPGAYHSQPFFARDGRLSSAGHHRIGTPRRISFPPPVGSAPPRPTRRWSDGAAGVRTCSSGGEPDAGRAEVLLEVSPRCRGGPAAVRSLGQPTRWPGWTNRARSSRGVNTATGGKTSRRSRPTAAS